MFTKNLNLIFGERNVGRSGFLFQLNNIFKSVSRRTLFFGATEEYNFSSINVFDYKFFYRQSDDRLISQIKEIVINEKINYVFIDDFDLILKKDIEKIVDIPAIKICSCLTNTILKTNLQFETYELLRNKNEFLLKFENKSIIVEEFYKSLKRDQKINLIL